MINMAANPLDAIIKLVLRHDDICSALASTIAEHAELFLRNAEKCNFQHAGCNDVVTVRNILTDARACDHCAAIIVYRSNKMIGPYHPEMISEEDWVDLPGAIALRHAHDLVTMANYGKDNSIVPEDPQQWH